MKIGRAKFFSFSKTRGESTGVFVVTLALGASAAAACTDDSKPCEDSQTCIEPTTGEGGGAGDDRTTGGSGGGGTGGSTGGSKAGSPGGGAGGGSGESTGGTTGGGSGRGGSSGNGGSPGEGGASGAGMAGEAGGGSGGGDTDDEAPTIVSITPAHGSASVERDIEVTAELSEAIAQASATSTSVTLEGPGGDVPGTVTVDDKVITFVPDHALSLRGSYTFTLDDAITDLAGNSLAASASAQFSVRDGAFGAKTHPFGTTLGRIIKSADVNAFGDMAIVLEAFPTGNGADSALFDGGASTWSSVLEIVDGWGHSIAIDAERRAAASVSGASGFAWSRFASGPSWLDAGLLGAYPWVVASPSGIAMSVSRDSSNETWSSQTMNIATGVVMSPLRLPLPADRATDPFPVASLEDFAVIGVSYTSTYDQELYVLWNRGFGWSAPEPLGLTPPSGVNSLKYDDDEQGNIVVAWQDSDGIWARVYERENDRWTGPEHVGSPMNQTWLQVDISAGHVVLSMQDGPDASVHIRQPGTGWITSEALQIPAVTTIDVAIDSSGNALAVWDTELNYRRYLAGSGWQAAADLDASVDDYQMWLLGAPDGTSMVLAPDLAANNSILAVRFE